jgi:CoA:oxalate CoA-transferase
VDALEEELEAAFTGRTTAEWFAILETSNACAIGKVNTVADLFGDPHVAARGMLVEVPLPYGLGGTLTLPGSPLHLSDTPAATGRTMPGHGEDTDGILTDWLAMGAAEIADLRAGGAIK